MQDQINQLQKQVDKMKSDFDSLSGSFFKNNFTSSQVFNKDVICTVRLKVPVFSGAPDIGEIGDIFALTNGKLYICTTASVSGAGIVWTLCGSQS